jgi:hypothetical protein
MKKKIILSSILAIGILSNLCGCNYAAKNFGGTTKVDLEKG